MTDELVEAHAKSKKLANHLHLPVQSGSNTVLQRMLREYTVEHYLTLLAKMRKANPSMVITSDMIAGFPNETEEEHQDTMKLLKLAQFDNIFSYTYSSRKGTKAARMDDVLTDDIRGRRLREIMALQLSIQAELRTGMIGKTYRILVDGKNIAKGVQKWQGRTSCSRIVHFEPLTPDQDYMWHWADVEITSSTALSTQGKLIKDLGKTL